MYSSLTVMPQPFKTGIAIPYLTREEKKPNNKNVAQVIKRREIPISNLQEWGQEPESTS